MSRTRILRIGALAICGALLGQPALAASTERMSVATSGGEGDKGSHYPAVSADGRFVAFFSSAENLVAGDTNSQADIFVRDRQTDVTERVSVDSNGNQGDDDSYSSALSANGRFVAFESRATNLVPDDTNATYDVFVHDRLTGLTERVSVASNGAQANDSSEDPRISANGRFVAFESSATDLVADDTNGKRDIFVHDRQTGVTERVNVDSAGGQANGYDSFDSAISADGRFVAFRSEANNLVSGDTNGYVDIFVRDRRTGTTERVSVDGAGAQASNGNSYRPSISADGRFVAFDSFAANLAANDTNGTTDVFVHDRLTGATELATVASNGSQANKDSYDASISADGRVVTFYSYATNLVPGDTNATGDIFVHDRLTGTTQRASVDSIGGEANGPSDDTPWISANGRFVAFESYATNLAPGDTNNEADIFVRDIGLLPDGNDDLAVDFGGAGLWQYLDNATWQKIHNVSPLAVAASDLDGSLKDEVIVSFAGHGLWARFDNATWKKLHNAAPSRFVAGDLDSNGSDELIVDFGGAGLWVFANNTTWVKRHKAGPQDLAVGDLDGNGQDELVVDFGGAGLWALFNNRTWAKLHNGSPVHLATGDLDGNGKAELIADFGGLGIWARFNNASWQKLHNGTSQGLSAGDFDGNGQEDLMVDFGAAGVWVRYNNATWLKRHNGSPKRMLATDLDGNGKAEAVLDFGPAGLWVRSNDASWTKLHPAATQGFAAGGVN